MAYKFKVVSGTTNSQQIYLNRSWKLCPSPWTKLCPIWRIKALLFNNNIFKKCPNHKIYGRENSNVHKFFLEVKNNTLHISNLRHLYRVSPQLTKIPKPVYYGLTHMPISIQWKIQTQVPSMSFLSRFYPNFIQILKISLYPNFIQILFWMKSG